MLFSFNYSTVYFSIVYYSIAMQRPAQVFPSGLIKIYLILSNCNIIYNGLICGILYLGQDREGMTCSIGPQGGVEPGSLQGLLSTWLAVQWGLSPGGRLPPPINVVFAARRTLATLLWGCCGCRGAVSPGGQPSLSGGMERRASTMAPLRWRRVEIMSNPSGPSSSNSWRRRGEEGREGKRDDISSCETKTK